MRFSKAKCKVLFSPQYPCRLGDEEIKSCLAEDFMVTEGSEFGYGLMMRAPSPESQLYPGHIKTVTCGLKTVILLL